MTEPTKVTRISEWLKGLDSHSIYNAAGLNAEFTNVTGLQPCWGTHSLLDARRLMKSRGLGGYLEGEETDRVIYGYEIADALARTHANFISTKIGRGRIFCECLEALQEAGL